MKEDLVEKLLKSGNKILEAAGNDLNKWSKLKHNKQDLELFLQFNLAHIKFKKKNEAMMSDVVCTSNTQFINVFSKLKESDKKKATRAKNNGIRTKDPSSVLTFNIIDNKYNTIPLDLWEIVNFITISPDNVELLDEYVSNELKRPIQDDLTQRDKKKKK